VLLVALTTLPRPSKAVISLVSPALSPDEKLLPSSTEAALRDVTLREMVHASREKGLELAPPAVLPVSAPVLTSGGKPQVLYMCDEYNGFCADVSWPLVMALEKFGTFHHLGYAVSRGSHNPGTVGLDFFTASYSSRYISFVGDEMYTAQQLGPNKWQVLQKPTASETDLLDGWDIPPYASPAYATPFIDIGGRYYMASAGYGGQALGDLSPDAAVALARTSAELAGGRSSLSVTVQALAAHIVGAVCLVTKNAPPACHGLPKALEEPVQPSAFNRETEGPT
jgi:hypothetical protein